MLWFVNPKNENKAINLHNITSIAVKNNMIYFDSHTWMFENNTEAKDVYESIIKLLQESRYRKATIM